MDYIDYRGNKFAVKKSDYWYRSRYEEYCVSVEEISDERICLPETYNREPIAEWHEKSAKGNLARPFFDRVKVLYIPASIKRIRIYNAIFPNLERVEIDPANTEFFTDGRLIISQKENELLYCPVCGGTSVEIPEYVRKIGEKAFCGTQYEEIRFPKKELWLSSDSFNGSRWLSLQGDIVVIGTTLYKVSGRMRQLTVPGHVRKIHPDAFSGGRVPEKMATPFMPGGRDIETLAQQRCISLTVTSRTAHINTALLRKWHSLEEVVIAEGHKKYRTVEGILYSRDGKTLVWYPPRKKGDVFAVPDGVRKIGEFAFANQVWLKKVILPESVSVLGTGAFSECRELEDIILSSAIKEIPDSSTYRGAGVFAGCKKLKSIILPEKLVYLGSFAFYESGLRSIAIKENLEQIGEYALMAEGLKEIILPPSVKRIGKGALFYVEKAEAYEGTAKGIVAAVNANWPYMKTNGQNLKWGRCRITVLHKRSGRRDRFLIPESLKKSAVYHLEIAWNGDHIDYGEYDQCLDEITDAEEKIEFAELGLLRFQEGEDNLYLDYIRRVSYKMGYRLLEEGKEKEFLLFLKQDFLSENSLLKLLKYSNEKGETVCSAYITEMLNRKRKKSGSFRI